MEVYERGEDVIVCNDSGEVLAKIPFCIPPGYDPNENSGVCECCGLYDFCSCKPIFGMKEEDWDFEHLVCMKITERIPDYTELGLTAEEFFNMIRGKVIKKIARR